MGRHSAPTPASTGRRAAVRPRYGRIASATTSVVVTLVAVLGGVGLVPTGSGSDAAGAAVAAPAPERDPAGDVREPAPTPSAAALALVARQHELRLYRLRGHPWVSRAAAARPEADPPVPEDSGRGRRVVFDIGDQRVWLVGAKGRVKRTYLVSGSVTDNLRPGTYEVYSTSRHAIGIDDSGTMQFMVRFAHGERAAIGFHDIPVKAGKPVQTRAELGTPQSHGCIRQARPDAKALWDFAPVGTMVVVTA